MKYLILKKVVVSIQKQGVVLKYKGNAMFTVLALNVIDIDDKETKDALITLDILGLRSGIGIRSKK